MNATAKKPAGLAAFTKKKTEPAAATTSTDAADSRTVAAAPARQRARGEVVALSIRLKRADWERVHHLAIDQGTSIQQLVLRGLSREFEAAGLPGLIAE